MPDPKACFLFIFFPAVKRQLDLKQVQITGMQKKVLELEETIKHKVGEILYLPSNVVWIG